MDNKVSAVVITKNEESKIAGCLDNIKWADEIVIIDDCSTDRTLDICRKYTNKIISSKSGGNLTKQRNMGIDNCNNEWILQMDADEIVSQTLRDDIIKAVNNKEDFAAFSILRKNYFLNHHMKGGGWQERPIKLFRKSRARFFGSSVHEILKVNGKIGEIQNPVDHFNFPTISTYITRQNYYSSVEAGCMYEENPNISKSKILYQIYIRPLKLVFKLFIKKGGYRDGKYGLILSILSAFRHILIYAKYWELQKNHHILN